MAITNQVTQTGLKDLSMGRFKSVLDNGGSLAKACRYIVAIKPPTTIKSFPRELHYLCEAAEFPGRGFSVVQTRYYGPSQMYPVNSEYQPLNLTFMCRSDSQERRFFDDWLDTINPVDNFNFEYPEKYYSQIELYQYAEYGEGGSSSTPLAHISYQWRLNKAWPTLVSPQPVSWADQDVLRMSVSFAYKYWDRPNLQ
ncbi:hypothetical protein EB001_09265 [bacterium]|nr:hypothetical protein [bacterium]